MKTERAAVLTAMLITTLALTRCTGNDTTPPETPANSAPPASDTPTAEEATNAAKSDITDEATCIAAMDVFTIVANADAGLLDGRMAAQEQKSWYRLATRVLDRIPTRGDGAVSDAIVALEAAAPAIAFSAMYETGIGTADWESGKTMLRGACSAVGVEMAIEMFTGG